MKTKLFLLIVFLIAAATIYASGPTDDKPASVFAGEYNVLISQVESKVVQLAEAIPQDKMSWRPADGVRSVAEVYLHIAYSTKYLLAAIGEKVPEEFNAAPNEFESSTTDVAAISKHLKDSFGYYKTACLKIDDEKLNSKVNFFGNEVSVRFVHEAMQNHIHEHLGQSIAYARMNGVVPPWNAKSDN